METAQVAGVLGEAFAKRNLILMGKSTQRPAWPAKAMFFTGRACSQELVFCDAVVILWAFEYSQCEGSWVLVLGTRWFPGHLHLHPGIQGFSLGPSRSCYHCFTAGLDSPHSWPQNRHQAKGVSQTQSPIPGNFYSSGWPVPGRGRTTDYPPFPSDWPLYQLCPREQRIHGRVLTLLYPWKTVWMPITLSSQPLSPFTLINAMSLSSIS